MPQPPRRLRIESNRRRGAAFMEQVETVQRLAGCSFGVGGVPFWGKLKASGGESAARMHSRNSAAEGLRDARPGRNRTAQERPCWARKCMRRKSGMRKRRSSSQASTALQAPDSKACSSAQNAVSATGARRASANQQQFAHIDARRRQGGRMGHEGRIDPSDPARLLTAQASQAGRYEAEFAMPTLSQRISLKAARGQPWPGSSRSSRSNPVGSPADCSARPWPDRSRARQSSAEDRSCRRLGFKILVLHTVFQQDNCI